MKRLMIAVAVAAGFIVLVAGAGFLWDIFGPSVILIRNAGDQPVRLVLTDADRSTQVWSGELGPGRRKTVMVWFRHEGEPELRCRDQTSRNTASLSYVTSHIPVDAEFEISGCDRIERDLAYR